MEVFVDYDDAKGVDFNGGSIMGEHIDKTKGKVKRAVGDVAGSEKLEREGVRDETKGRAEGAVNDVKERAKKTEKSIKSSAKQHNPAARREKRS